MTDDREESNVLSFDDKQRQKKERFDTLKKPATKGDLEILVNKICELEDELDAVNRLLNKTLRIIKEMSKQIPTSD